MTKDTRLTISNQSVHSHTEPFKTAFTVIGFYCICYMLFFFSLVNTQLVFYSLI